MKNRVLGTSLDAIFFYFYAHMDFNSIRIINSDFKVNPN